MQELQERLISQGYNKNSQKLITAFKRNGNLKELIGSNCIKNGKVKQVKNTFTIGKCSPCLSKTSNLRCSQLTSTMTFISQ